MALLWLEVIPLAWAKPLLATFGEEDQLSRSDNANVLRIVGVRVNDGAGWVGCEQHVAAFRRQSVGLERPVKPRK
jgi:hypothetical protein